MPGKSRQTANLVSTRTGIGTTTPVTDLNIVGVITATKFFGDGSSLSGISAGGQSPSRITISGVTTQIPANGIGNTEITGYKTYGLMNVGLSTAAWLRLYTDSTSRSNDASRAINIDPTTGSGVIAEVATAGISSVKITPYLIGFNADSPNTNTIYISIKNLSGITTSISFDLTILKLEE
jgi:hypothetical protein